MLETGRVYLGDCLELMKEIPDRSVGLILTDLPYAITQIGWDKALDLRKLWEQFLRVIQRRRAIILFGSQPFTTDLISSYREGFKYELIWDKTFGRQPQLANVQPMKRHENIAVFSYRGDPVLYHKQMVPLEKPYFSGGAGNNAGSSNDHQLGLKKMPKLYTHRTPDTVLAFKPVPNGKNKHPTQKPVDLLEWLIKAYSDEGDTVLDATAGSGSTGVASLRTGRRFIGMELDPKYHQQANEWLFKTLEEMSMYIPNTAECGESNEGV